MNDHDELQLAQIQLDRMVDGELSPEEQRQLLAACEERPVAWRSLAMAYVEAQAFRESLAVSIGLRTSAMFVSPGSEAVAASAIDALHAAAPAVKIARQHARVWPDDRGYSDQSSRRFSFKSASMVAALLLLTLSMGYGMGVWWQRLPAVGSGDAGQVAYGGADEGIATQRAKGDHRAPSTPANGRRNQITGDAGDGGRAVAGGPRALASPQPDERVQLTVMDPQSGDFHQVEVPLFQQEAVQAWAQGVEDVIPRRVADGLRGQGYRVEQQRRFVRVRLGDGRRVLVPVDDVEIEMRDYQ